MEHPEDLDPLLVLEMEHDVLADHEAVVVSDRLQGEEVVVLEGNPVAQKLHHPVLPRLIRRLEVLGEEMGRGALQFLVWVGCGLDHVAEVVVAVVVGGVDAEVLEPEGVHLLREDHRDGVGFLP